MKTNEPTETELGEFNNWFETHFQTWLETKRQRGDYNEISSFRQSLKTSWFASRKHISTPSADVVTVPREEWALLREIERYARIQLPGTTLALRDIDALRSGEAPAQRGEG